MIELLEYMQNLISGLLDAFQSRLLYVGLQGSWARDEAEESSDLDVMVVLDKLRTEDLAGYRKIVSGMEDFEKSCGFICGKEELEHWNRGEICQLVHETVDYYGRLEPLVPPYTCEDVRNHVKICTGNLYHEICHRYIHAPEEVVRSKLGNACKSVFYILQNYCYIKNGVYIRTKRELLGRVKGIHREALEASQFLRYDKIFDTEQIYTLMLSWCQEILRTV